MEEGFGRIKGKSLISGVSEENFGDHGVKGSRPAVKFKKMFEC